MSEFLRVYLDPAEIGADGYPHAWHNVAVLLTDTPTKAPGIKDIVREQAGHRCERCGHPYRKGEHGRGEWSPCDLECEHYGPFRWLVNGEWLTGDDERHEQVSDVREAQWRILTVHHLNGVKHDCRWWNLAALCQRCHLTIQGRVLMERVYPFEHSEWFKPHAAGWYAASYLGEELTREETLARLDELLALERAA